MKTGGPSEPESQVLFTHARLIAETGGSSGLRDLAMLASAVARPQAIFGGNDLYPDLIALEIAQDVARKLIESYLEHGDPLPPKIAANLNQPRRRTKIKIPVGVAPETIAA